MADPEDYANEADVEEQATPAVVQDDDHNDEHDDEQAAGSGSPRRRDDVDEGDFIEQIESVPVDDEDYPYSG